MTDDWETGHEHVKTVTNPLHVAEDAFPTLERTIEDSCTPLEVHANASAKAVDNAYVSL